MLSCWYTRRELALRTAVLYSGLVLATAISGLIAAGVFAGMDGALGLSGWQWLFIIEGAGSFLMAIFAAFLLPDYTDSTTGSAKWLFTTREREVAAQRIALDRVSLPEADRSVWHGLGLAVKDYRTWIFVRILPTLIFFVRY
jgi:MFS family permease